MGHGLFFESDDSELYGFVHPAEGHPRPTGVLFVHGAFEERQDAHRVIRNAATRLAARGFPVLRFDLYGHGDSAGLFEHATLARWARDTVSAWRALVHASGCLRVSIVGLRLGAAIAARAARELPAEACDRLVLWQPVTSGRDYVMELLRSQLSAEMVVHRRATSSREALIRQLETGHSINLFGYRLTPALFRELDELDLANELRNVTAPTLVLDVVRSETARGASDLESRLVSLAPDRVRVERAVEQQPIHGEGKLFITNADRVVGRTARFLEGVA